MAYLYHLKKGKSKYNTVEKKAVEVEVNLIFGLLHIISCIWMTDMKYDWLYIYSKTFPDFPFCREDRTKSGHILGDAQRRDHPDMQDNKNMSPAPFALLRLLTHTSMLYGAQNNPEVILFLRLLLFPFIYMQYIHYIAKSICSPSPNEQVSLL